MKVKVHGLGYVKPDMVDIGFYSCDATSWNAGKYGEYGIGIIKDKYRLKPIERSEQE